MEGGGFIYLSGTPENGTQRATGAELFFDRLITRWNDGCGMAPAPGRNRAPRTRFAVPASRERLASRFPLPSMPSH